MARKGGKNGYDRSARRGHSLPTTSFQLHRRLPLSPILRSNPLPNWHPPHRDARLVKPSQRIVVSFSGTPAVTNPARSATRFPSSRLQIATPKKAFICARRSIRREVLFASGRSGSGNRKPRFSQQSKYRC